MSLTSLQKAVLSELDVTTWQRDDAFQWQPTPPSHVASSNVATKDENIESQKPELNSRASVVSTESDVVLPEHAVAEGESPLNEPVHLDPASEAQKTQSTEKPSENNLAKEGAPNTGLTKPSQPKPIVCDLAISDDLWRLFSKHAQDDVKSVLNTMNLEFIRLKDDNHYQVRKACLVSQEFSGEIETDHQETLDVNMDLAKIKSSLWGVLAELA